MNTKFTRLPFHHQALVAYQLQAEVLEESFSYPSTLIVTWWETSLHLHIALCAYGNGKRVNACKRYLSLVLKISQASFCSQTRIPATALSLPVSCKSPSRRWAAPSWCLILVPLRWWTGADIAPLYGVSAASNASRWSASLNSTCKQLRLESFSFQAEESLSWEWQQLDQCHSRISWVSSWNFWHSRRAALRFGSTTPEQLSFWRRSKLSSSSAKSLWQNWLATCLFWVKTVKCSFWTRKENSWAPLTKTWSISQQSARPQMIRSSWEQTEAQSASTIWHHSSLSMRSLISCLCFLISNSMAAVTSIRPWKVSHNILTLL